MNKRVLIIGSAGMAGHLIYTFLKENGVEVCGIDVRPNDFSVDQVLDTTVFQVLRAFLSQRNFDCVVNCAAILGKAMLDQPALARRVNVELPHELVSILVPERTRLFHISSDFVFSGDRPGGAYSELDVKDSVTPYGLYKREGEVNAPNASNLRLSIIGPTPQRIIPNFLNNVIASSNDSLWGLTNAYWTGITTLELAKTLLGLIGLEHIAPIYHLCSQEKETRYQTIRNIMDTFGINLPLEARMGEPKDYSLISTTFPYRKPLAEQLTELRQWMLQHPDLYGGYSCLTE